jgi:hypothetical protein
MVPETASRFAAQWPGGRHRTGEQLRIAVAEMAGWMDEFGGLSPHPSLTVDADAVERATVELRAGCGRDKTVTV